MLSNKGMKRQRSSETCYNTSCNNPISWLDSESIDVVVAPPLPLLRTEQSNPSTTPISTATKAIFINNNDKTENITTTNDTNETSSATRAVTSTIIRTPIATSHFCNEIFIERLKVELLNKYQINYPIISSPGTKRNRSHLLDTKKMKNEEVNSTTSSNNTSTISSERIQRNRNLLFQRLKIGMNACTRILESYHSKLITSNRTKGTNSDELQPQPLLLVLTTDIQPVSIQCHLPVLASQCNIPLLLLPASSNEIGKLFRIKNVSSIVCMSRNDGLSSTNNNSTTDDNDVGDETKLLHSDLDSFISFIQRKIHAYQT